MRILKALKAYLNAAFDMMFLGVFFAEGVELYRKYHDIVAFKVNAFLNKYFTK